LFFHSSPSAARLMPARPPVFTASRMDGVAGDPWGRRVIFLHPGKGAWWRLLHSVPAGQEWVTVPASGGALSPLLVERGGRKPVLVAGVLSAGAALAVALDHPTVVGGVMIVDDVGAESGFRRGLNIVAGLLGLPVDGNGLGALEAELPALRVPVTLMQGSAPGGILGVLENGLTGCRTLTVVAVPDAAAVRPRTHATELRTALVTLIAAVERARM